MHLDDLLHVHESVDSAHDFIRVGCTDGTQQAQQEKVTLISSGISYLCAAFWIRMMYIISFTLSFSNLGIEKI